MSLTKKFFLCIDPGKSKIGICILDYNGNVLELKITTPSNLENYLQEIIINYNFSKIILGQGTAHEKVLKILSENLNINKEIIILVEEKFSTEQARKLYFIKNPPKGLKKFVPLTMQIPKENIDSYAAWVLGIKWLQENKS